MTLVALHTQHLLEPVSSAYLDLLGRAIRAARLNKTFPERRQLAGTLRALGAQAHQGLYDGVYLDSRSGLPNMASFTRPLADRGVGAQALGGYEDQAVLDAKRDEAEVFARMAAKRRYFELLQTLTLAPVDEHRVLLRRHEPESSRASFRVELTKLDGSGAYLRVVIDLTQTASVWSHKLVDLDSQGEVASGTEALRGMVYRFASYDAETLFIRLHELEGVHVERVQRGILGPMRFSIQHGDDSVTVLESKRDAMETTWSAACQAQDGSPLMLASFATDVAALDVREEKSNDPCAPLLSDGIRDVERARYLALRERYPFRVYKDRKFVVTPTLVDGVRQACIAAGCKNLVYPLRG
ncbi:MAG: hypothetical protein KUG77_02395 [Nannocystaceae bacterium]|nr:hypothetical protein [Nannocystaceae bacterium]